MAFARGYVNSTIRKGDRPTLIFIIIGLVNAKSAVIIYIYDSRFLGTSDSSPCDGGILCLFAPGVTDSVAWSAQWGGEAC